jgi:NhaA family Na+:H+ antiporter
MSLFVAGLAFTGEGSDVLLESAKLGVLAASLVAGVTGYLVMRRATARPRAEEPAAEDVEPLEVGSGAL